MADLELKEVLETLETKFIILWLGTDEWEVSPSLTLKEAINEVCYADRYCDYGRKGAIIIADGEPLFHITEEGQQKVLKTQTTLDEIKQAVLLVANKQGHDSCWYYPEIFIQILNLLGIELNELNLDLSKLPTREEFEQGCKKFADELYSRERIKLQNHPG